MIVWTYGRFQPPHIGHEAMIRWMVNQYPNAEHHVFTSKSFDKKRNPLPIDFKHELLKSYWGDVAIIHKQPNHIIPILKMLERQCDEMVMVVGQDRIEDFTRLIQRYTSFKKFDVVSHPNPLCIRATTIRNYVKQDNLTEFSKYIPSNAPVLFEILQDLLEDD